MKTSQKEKQGAIYTLTQLIQPTDIVYTIVRKVSKSGMQREIMPLVFGDDGRPLYLGYSVSQLLELPQSKDDGSVIVRGGGMDMGERLIQDLSWALGWSENTLRHQSL